MITRKSPGAAAARGASEIDIPGRHVVSIISRQRQFSQHSNAVQSIGSPVFQTDHAYQCAQIYLPKKRRGISLADARVVARLQCRRSEGCGIPSERSLRNDPHRTRRQPGIAITRGKFKGMELARMADTVSTRHE